jgi:NADH dehydrogenase FAD-containing subunit
MLRVLYVLAHALFTLAFALYGLLLALFGAAIALIPSRRTRPRLVIVGGGFTGCLVAKRVERFFDTTLVDAKDYFEFTPSILRVLTEPNHLSNIQIPHARYLDLRFATVQHESAVAITPSAVLLQSGRQLPFEYLVFATGSSYAAPIKESPQSVVYLASRGATLAQAHHELQRSKSALIIGGGIVAVELAAEIVEYFGVRISVTIAHSGDRLMSRQGGAVSPSASAYCAQQLGKMGVRICFGERVVQGEGRVCVSQTGAEFVADVVFVCTGIVPNSQLFRASPAFASALDASGFVNVDAQLRVKGFSNVFAGGDVVNIREEKLAQTAEYQGSVIAANLFALRGGATPTASYTPGVRPLIISLGRVDAAFCWGAWVITGFFAALMKEVVEFKVMVGYRWRFAALFSFERPSTSAKDV